MPGLLRRVAPGFDEPEGALVKRDLSLVVDHYRYRAIGLNYNGHHL